MARSYSGYDRLPNGRASDKITEGCLVLEGGAWRGLYSQGVLDALMEADLNFHTVVGVSAGAMAGMAYTAGQIGFSIRVNLKYRHDRNYCGMGAFRRDHGITGFSYFYDTILPEMGFDEEKFMRPERELVAVATDVDTGKSRYFRKGSCDIKAAVQASATVPYISKPVQIGEASYLDGGCAVKIPYHYALHKGYEKIVVVRTRDRSFRSKETKESRRRNMVYAAHPGLQRALTTSARRYNRLLDEIDEAESLGSIFVFAPGDPLDVGRFEGDLEKLGELYWKGYGETWARMEALRRYLGK